MKPYKRPLFIIILFFTLLVGVNTVCAGTIDKALDWYLQQSGLDPNAVGAKESKKIAIDAFNPFVSEKEYRQDMDALVDVITERNVDKNKINKIYNDSSISDTEKKKRLGKLLDNINDCSICGQSWPAYYRYCPLDGKKLTANHSPKFTLNGNSMKFEGSFYFESEPYYSKPAGDSRIKLTIYGKGDIYKVKISVSKPAKATYGYDMYFRNVGNKFYGVENGSHKSEGSFVVENKELKGVFKYYYNGKWGGTFNIKRITEKR